MIPANANAIRVLTSQIRNEKFAAVQLYSIHLRISLRKEGCDVKFTLNSHRIRIRRNHEPGLIGKIVSLSFECLLQTQPEKNSTTIFLQSLYLFFLKVNQPHASCE